MANCVDCERPVVETRGIPGIKMPEKIRCRECAMKAYQEFCASEEGRKFVAGLKSYMEQRHLSK